MPIRSIWKGVLRLADFRLPVKLYSAVQDRGIHFHLLHDQDMVRVKQRMVNPITDATVEIADARKGYEVERGRFVVLDREELESLQPPDSREIAITRFLDPAVLNHQWYVRPYWLGPDGDHAEYAAFAKALDEEKMEGLARWVMRKKEYLGALRVESGFLMLVTLREIEEVIRASDLKSPTGREPDPKETRLAEQLVDALEDDFDPADYHDEFRERVVELIEAKQQGETVEVREYEPEPEPESLEKALRASLKSRK